MNYLNAAVGDFRPARKCFSISGSLLLALTLLVVQAASRSSDEAAFDVGEEYADVDNVEWHHVRVVDGVMHEDHPVIMYKEDFVSEDYDPITKNRTAAALQSNPTAEDDTPPAPRHHTRKYKDISQRRHRRNRTETEQYNALKPEKIYFDVLPAAPVVVSDDSGATDSKFDVSKIRAELISLVDAEAEAEAKARAELEAENESEAQSKQLLSKRPKKYHRRMRRDAEEPHKLQKRNPYYRIDGQSNNNLYGYHYQQNQAYTPQYKYSPPGKPWNKLHLPVPPVVVPRFGGENEPDRVVWGVVRRPSINSVAPAPRPQRPTIRPPRPSSTTPPPLFHDSNPENIDLSFMGGSRPVQQTPTRPSIVSNPQEVDTSIFITDRPFVSNRNSIPSSDSNTANNGPANSMRPLPRPVTTTARPPRQAAPVSECVWAIVSCCSTNDNKLRYNCFEQHGCMGAFWDLNPCASDSRDALIDYVSELYNEQV